MLFLRYLKFWVSHGYSIQRCYCSNFLLFPLKWRKRSFFFKRSCLKFSSFEIIYFLQKSFTNYLIILDKSSSVDIIELDQLEKSQEKSEVFIFVISSIISNPLNFNQINATKIKTGHVLLNIDKGPGKSTALLSAMYFLLSAPMLRQRVTSRQGGGRNQAESGKYIDVSRKQSRWFTLTQQIITKNH